MNKRLSLKLILALLLGLLCMGLFAGGMADAMPDNYYKTHFLCTECNAPIELDKEYNCGESPSLAVRGNCPECNMPYEFTGGISLSHYVDNFNCRDATYICLRCERSIANDDQKQQHSWQDGKCNNRLEEYLNLCTAECTGHVWNTQTKICNVCGATCIHNTDDSARKKVRDYDENGTCKACGDQCDHSGNITAHCTSAAPLLYLWRIPFRHRP